MPATAAAMEATINPYPRRRLNHGPNVARANDTMPRAKSPAFVDRNAVAFSIGPSERRGRGSFAFRSGVLRHHQPPPWPPRKRLGLGETESGTKDIRGGPA